MKRLLTNTLFSSADSVILIALSLLVTPILIAQFGIAGYGVFVFLSIFSVFGALSFFDLGMEGALMTHVARFEADGAHDKIRDAMLIAVLYYGVIGLLLAFTLFGAAEWLITRFDPSEINRSQGLNAVHLVAINILFQFLCMPFIAVLQGLRRFAFTKGISSVLNIVQYLLIMAVAIWTQRIDAAFLVIATLTALRLVAYVLAYLQLPQYGFRAALDRSLFRMLWDSSSSLFLNRLIGLVYNQTGKFLIWWKLPIANMAVYDVINRPASLIRVLTSMIYSAIIPEVARLKQLDDTGSIKDLYVRLVRYAYILVLPPAVAITIHASRLLEFWVGSDFSSKGPLVGGLMLTAIISPPGAIASTLVVGLDMVGRTIWISLIGTLIYFSASIVLISDAGLFGIILGAFAAQVVMGGLYFVVMNRLLSIRSSELLRPISSIALLAGGIGCLHTTLAIAGVPAIWWLVIAGFLGFSHYLTQFAFLLDRQERNFMLGKFRFSRRASSIQEA